MDSILNFLHDPDNAVIFYGIAGFMVLDGLFLLLVKPLIAKKQQENSPVVSKEDTPVGTVLKLSAFVSIIAGIALAAYVFIRV